MEEKWMIINTYVLHCQSLALNRPRLFSASVFPISVPPAFIILASVVFSENRKIMQYESGEIMNLSVYTVLIEASLMLTPTTSITAGSSGKVYISTSENKVKNI